MSPSERIAGLLDQGTTVRTPLQRALTRLVLWLAVVAVAFCVAVMLAELLHGDAGIGNFLFVGDRMTGRLALCRTLERLTPPLQADGAELGLAHLFGNAGKLDVERAEGKEIAARLARREQGSNGAIGIP